LHAAQKLIRRDGGKERQPSRDTEREKESAPTALGEKREQREATQLSSPGWWVQ